MKLSPLSPSPHAADIPIERLAANDHLSEKEKVGEACRQFEAVLLRQIIANGQKTHFKSSLTNTSASSEIYQDMFTNQLADCISRSGALGLAQSLSSQLSHDKISPEPVHS